MCARADHARRGRLLERFEQRIKGRRRQHVDLIHIENPKLPLRRRKPVHQREILALDGTRGKLAHEVGLRLECLGHHQQAARFLVEPVDDAGTRHRLQGRGVM